MSDSGMGVDGGWHESAEAGGPGPSGLPMFELNGTFLKGTGGRAVVRRTGPGPRLQATWAVESAAEQMELILDESGALLPFHFLRTGDLRGRAVVKLLRGDGGRGPGFWWRPGSC